MSNLYYRIEKLCRSNQMTITAMCKKSGASRASLSDLKVGRKQALSTETLSKIAKALGCSVGLLLGEKPKWESAIDKFGFCWDAIYGEKVKDMARLIICNPSVSLNDRINAQITIFKTLFSRSLESCDYDLNHVDFESYIAMILWQGADKHEIPLDVYHALVERYGTKPGLPTGTLYFLDNKTAPADNGKLDILDDVDIAFYGNFKKLNEDEKETIRDMVRLMRQRKEKRSQ